MTRQRFHFTGISAMILLIAALAGCASPDESGGETGDANRGAGAGAGNAGGNETSESGTQGGCIEEGDILGGEASPDPTDPLGADTANQTRADGNATGESGQAAETNATTEGGNSGAAGECPAGDVGVGIGGPGSSEGNETANATTTSG